MGDRPVSEQPVAADAGMYGLSLPVALRLLSDLVSRPVTGQEIGPVSLADETVLLRGVFLDGRTPAALFLLDVRLAASLAAALVMLPPDVVEDCARARSLPPALLEHHLEVVNVCSRLINRAGGPPYRLIGQLAPGEPTPSEVQDVLVLARERIDLRLTVEGYGTGVFTILVR